MPRPKPRKAPSSDHHLRPQIVFGQMVRERRIALGLTQSDLEDDDVLDRSYISKIELGKRQPCLKAIISIARAFQITPAELMTDFMNRFEN